MSMIKTTYSLHHEMESKALLNVHLNLWLVYIYMWNFFVLYFFPTIFLSLDKHYSNKEAVSELPIAISCHA